MRCDAMRAVRAPELNCRSELSKLLSYLSYVRGANCRSPRAELIASAAALRRQLYNRRDILFGDVTAPVSAHRAFLIVALTHSSRVRFPKHFAPFWGTFLPAPQEGAIPADESVLRAYDECLREEQGHHTSVDDLLKVRARNNGSGRWRGLSGQGSYSRRRR